MGEDVVTLVLPREPDFHAVARLVLAGLGSRLQLTYEHLEDLQLGVGTLLEHSEGDESLVVRVAVENSSISTEVGPFAGDELRDELARGDDGGIGLKRLLETVVDSVELRESPSGTVVRLVKHVDLANAQH